MNKSIRNVFDKLKDHPNVEFFPRHKLGQFVGKKKFKTELKREPDNEIDKAIKSLNR